MKFVVATLLIAAFCVIASHGMSIQLKTVEELEQEARLFGFVTDFVQQNHY